LQRFPDLRGNIEESNTTWYVEPEFFTIRLHGSPLSVSAYVSHSANWIT
jgi:hypothetical protein